MTFGSSGRLRTLQKLLRLTTDQQSSTERSGITSYSRIRTGSTGKRIDEGSAERLKIIHIAGNHRQSRKPRTSAHAHSAHRHQRRYAAHAQSRSGGQRPVDDAAHCRTPPLSPRVLYACALTSQHAIVKKRVPPWMYGSNAACTTLTVRSARRLIHVSQGDAHGPELRDIGQQILLRNGSQ